MAQNLSQSAHQIISASRAFYAKTYTNHQKNLTGRTYADSCNLADSVSTAVDPKKRTSQYQSAFESTYKSSCSLFDSTQKDNIITSRTIKTVLAKNTNEILNDNSEESVEKLLEEGYMAVVARSDMKEALKLENERLEREIVKVKKEIEPEIQRTKVLKETLKECQGIQAKYVEEIEMLQGEVQKVKKIIEGKKQANKKTEEQMRTTVNKRSNAVHLVRQETLTNKEIDEEKMEKLVETLSEVKREELTLTNELNNLKKQLGQIKGTQGRKQHVIEEKSRMFFGVLQHK